MKNFLAENVDLMVEISEKIRQEVGIGNEDDAGAADVIDLDAEEENAELG